MTDPDLIERVASEYHGAEWGYFTPEDHAYWRGTIATIIRLIDADRERPARACWHPVPRPVSGPRPPRPASTGSSRTMSGPDLAARRAWLDHRQNMRRHNRDAWDAEYKALTGERVIPTQHPSMNVIVNTVGHGRLALALPAADPIRPRIDTVCQRGGTVQVIHGTPSVLPEPPQAPAGWETVAHVRVPANATSIPSGSIEGVHP